MFKKSPEQRIMQEADRMVSMKEDFDAVSWSRVTEIAKLLQEEHTEEQRLEWARELMSIARSNTWVLDKFGVAPSSMTGTVISSGIEMQQGDQYLSNADTPTSSSTVSQQQGVALGSAPQSSAPREAERQSFDQQRSAPQAAAHTEVRQNDQPLKSTERASMPTLNEVAENLGTTGGLPRIPGFGLPEIAPEAAAGVIASLPKLDLFLSGADAFSTVSNKPAEDDNKIEPPQPSKNHGFNIPFGPDRTNDPADAYFGTNRRSADFGQTTQMPPVEAAHTTQIPPVVARTENTSPVVAEATRTPSVASLATQIPPVETTQMTPGMGLLTNLPRAFSDDETEMLSDAERELRALEVMYAMMAAENGELAKSDTAPAANTVSATNTEPTPSTEPAASTEPIADPKPVAVAQPAVEPAPVVLPERKEEPKPVLTPEVSVDPTPAPQPEQVHEIKSELKGDRAAPLDSAQLSPDEVAANVKKILFDLPETKREEMPLEVQASATHPVAKVSAQRESLPLSAAGNPGAPVNHTTAPSLSPEDKGGNESYIETKGELRKKRKKPMFGRHGGKAAAQVEQPVASDPVSESSTAPVLPSTPDAPTVPELPSVPQSRSVPDEIPAEGRESLDKRDLAQFRHVYSGKKGKLCLYEDADGHLVAVDPSRFA